MRKSLYHAIVEHGYHGPRVVEVTTERGRKWWGRDSDGCGTSGVTSAILSRHETSAEARSRLAVMCRIQEQSRAVRNTLNNADRRLQALSRDHIAQAATGAVPPPLPSPRIVWSDQAPSPRDMRRIIDLYVSQNSGGEETDFGLASALATVLEETT